MDNERLKMEKLYAVITVARQVEGEYVFIKTERAFKSAQKADVHLKTLRAQFVTEAFWADLKALSRPVCDRGRKMEAPGSDNIARRCDVPVRGRSF
jgi:hypothetical protein